MRRHTTADTQNTADHADLQWLAETIKTLDDLRDEYGRRFGDDWASSEMRTIRIMLNYRLSALLAKQYLEGEK